MSGTKRIIDFPTSGAYDGYLLQDKSGGITSKVARGTVAAGLKAEGLAWSPDLADYTDPAKGAALIGWKNKTLSQWLDIFRGTCVNVMEYGADNTGATNSDAAVVAAMAIVTASVTGDPFGGDRVSRKYLYFPAGSYLLTDGILQSSWGLKGRGLRVIGDGPGLSQISFTTSTGKRLFHNNNAYLWIEVIGILFTSNSRTNDFMYSYSNPPGGAVQRNKFIDCEWAGQWGKGFYLEGGNNNSEWHFLHCGVGGGMDNFLYTPAGTASDQFLNFWFDHMKFWPSDAGSPNNWIEMNLGGHIHITNSDVSGYQSGTLFKLKGTSHAYGVCFFSATNVRYEMKTINTKVLESEWPQGSISFNGNDWSSQRGISGIDAVNMFDFNDVNFAGAKVAFRQCSMIGLVRFAHNSDDFRHFKITTFDNCDFQQEEPHLAFVFTSSTNDGGHRSVLIRESRGSVSGSLSSVVAWATGTVYAATNQRKVGPNLFECTIGGTSGATAPIGKGAAISDGGCTWKWIRTEARNYYTDQTLNGFGVVAAHGLVEHIAIFKASGGPWPLNSGTPNYLNLILPPNAIVTGANLYSPGGAGGSGTTSAFTIQNEEASPRVFATVNVSPGSAAFANAGIDFYPVGTDIKKRSIVLVSGTGVTSLNSNATGIVKYLA
jgi:hypothetical protein